MVLTGEFENRQNVKPVRGLLLRPNAAPHLMTLNIKGILFLRHFPIKLPFLLTLTESGSCVTRDNKIPF